MIRQVLRIQNKISRFRMRFGTRKYRVKYLRKQGMKIGEDCLIFPSDFGSEPYLIELGNRVAISGNCVFINHEGGEWLFRDQHPTLNVFGKIIIGDNTFIGIGCILLPGTKIGANCVIGAGSVVRGTIADNSVLMGNPAKIIMKTSMFEKLIINNKNRLDTRGLDRKKEQEILLDHFNG